MQNCLKLSAKAASLASRLQMPSRAISLMPRYKDKDSNKKSNQLARSTGARPPSAFYYPPTPFYDDDSFLGAASDMIRSMDREFDAVRNRMLHNFSQAQSWSNPDISSHDMIKVDKDGNRNFEIAFDMRGFKPEEIKVKTEGRLLVVKAKKESTTDGDYFLREFSHCYTLPEDLTLENLKSKWSDDSTLVIEAELPKTALEAEPKERVIQIEHKGESKSSEGGETNKTDGPKANMSAGKDYSVIGSGSGGGDASTGQTGSAGYGGSEGATGQSPPHL